MFRHKGTIVEWNDDRGFGFIAPEKGGERVFCHIKSFRDLAQRPARGQVFTYQLAKDMGGRSRAREIRSADALATSMRTSAAPQAEWPGSTGAAAPYVGGLVFLAALTALVFFARLPWLVFPWYLGLSLVTFVVFGWDKASARGGFRRTPEKSLGALALAGGWPGGWIAMQSLRHKTQKASFHRRFWFAAVLNIAVLGVMAYGGPDIWGAHVPPHPKTYKQP
jgi:uncharacterized membrane protein YsdA (DUF1294 family)/cold shock CspA family protein